MQWSIKVRVSWFATAAALFVSLPAPLYADSLDSLHAEIGPIKPFTLTDGEGKVFQPADLSGKVWIAHFFYRSCTEGCAMTTASMQELQRVFRGKTDVALVSINLDPDNDTPLLKQHAEMLGADPEQWRFLTGKADDIYQIVQSSFFQSAAPTGSKDPGKAVLHTFNLILVDRTGIMRGYVNGKDPEAIGPMIERIRSLARERYVLPAVNAGLNGFCAVLLISGYLCIRRRLESAHKSLMLAALAVSAIFLTSYLYYHFAVLEGRPTRFSGQGLVRPVYFAILLSHTVLAALVAPLALFVAYQGLRDNRPRHVKLARWTLPIWLYVSLTGVLVYWLLYHIYPPI